MKKLLRTPGIKLLLSLLFIVCLLVTTLGAAGAIAIFSNYNSFFSPASVLESDLLETVAKNAAFKAYNKYKAYTDSVNPEAADSETVYKLLSDSLSSDNCNYAVCMTDSNGNILFENYKAENPLDTVTTSFSSTVSYTSVAFSLSFPDWDSYYEYFNTNDSLTDGNRGYNTVVSADESGIHVDITKTEYMSVPTTVTCSIRSDLQPVDELYYEVMLIEYAVYLKNLILPLTLLFFLLTVLFAALLSAGAGRTNNSDEVKLQLFDKLPYELFLLIITGAVLLSFLLIANSDFSSVRLYLGGAAMAVIWSVLLLWLITGTARRSKNGHMWKNTVCFYAYKLIARAARATGRGIKYLAVNINLYWKTAIICLAVIGAELIYIGAAMQYADTSDSIVLLMLIEKLISIPLIIVAIINIKKIRDIGQKLARGEIDEEINTAHMLPEFRRHANNLGKINDGIKLAVSEQLKSERMQTELITNVSHDIKTPLTSIINYVDLLSKEDMPSEKAKSYLEVIDRQSKRLKKLAVDVVEASKATSGSIEVNYERTDVSVLLSQTTGEYADKLTAAGLELMAQPPTEPMYIFADSRLIWRVFDNLMNNICKYSQRGTRVYLAAISRGGRVEISFKNVSESALNISADELMERFVRGDASRNTEGSGLGLAISRSLTELQNGSLELAIDGDLFKATVCFPLLPE